MVTPVHQLVQLLVVSDGELQMTRINSCLLVIAGSIAGQLQDLCRQILHHGRQVDRGTGTHALGVVPLAQETVDPADGEL